MVGLVATLATCPPAVAVVGTPFATTATTMSVAAVGSLEGLSVGASVVAMGEGAIVGLGVIASGGSSSAGIALASMAGPVGWAIVGCNKNDDHNSDSGYTWDCWKPVVRDTSTQPSCGITLRDLAAHPNVQSVSVDRGGLIVGNIFGERFSLNPVTVKGALAFHASILSS